MDISDILDGLNAPHLARDPFAEDSYDPDKQNSGEADLQALTRVWVNERGAAELLPCVFTTILNSFLPLLLSATSSSIS